MSPENHSPESFTAPPPVEALPRLPEETIAAGAGYLALAGEVQTPETPEQATTNVVVAEGVAAGENKPVASNGGEWTRGPDGKGWVREPAFTETAIDTKPARPESRWVPDENGGWRREAPSGREDSGVVPSLVGHQEAPEQSEVEKSQYDKNIELLKGSEMGKALSDAYKYATRIDPRLREVIIVPYDESVKGAKGSAFARGADRSESGKHEVHIRTGAIDNSLDLMQETLDSVPGLREMLAEKLLLDDPSELTPMQVHTFVMLHELGHISEFMDHAEDIDGLRERQDKEKDALPLGKIRTSEIIDPTSKGGQHVRDNWQEISKRFGVSTIEELAKITNAAHRNMTSEKAADDFATEVLNLEPAFFESLGKEDLSEIRNFYQDQAA